jgi:hypothetical protein
MPNAGPALTDWQLLRVAFFSFGADCAKKITDFGLFWAPDRSTPAFGHDSLLAQAP